MFQFKFPDDGTRFINLPNLKKLQITLHDWHRPLMDTLVKSCPSLEDLSLRLCSVDDNHFVDVSAPKLKRLFILIEESWSSVTYHKFVINAPKLELCDVEGYLVSCEFVNNPSNQVRIYVRYSYPDFKNDDRGRLLLLFQGISCVESLILEHWNGDLLNILSELDESALIFHNLIHLKIVRDVEDHRVWKQLPCLPLCMLGNLKWLEMHFLMGNDFEIKMLQHILCNATVLQQLHVSVHRYDHEEEKYVLQEYEFCKKLFILSKSSLSCKIEFSGEMVTASSEDYIDGILSCKIEDQVLDG